MKDIAYRDPEFNLADSAEPQDVDAIAADVLANLSWLVPIGPDGERFDPRQHPVIAAHWFGLPVPKSQAQQRRDAERLARQVFGRRAA